MRKKVLIILGILIVITSGLLISVLNMKGKMISYAMPDEEKQSGIVMYVHNGTSYVKSTSVPINTHVLNRSKSKCEGRGSIVSYNRATGTIQYRLPSTDVCYVYFDKDTTAPTVNAFYMGGSSNPTYITNLSTSSYIAYTDTDLDIKDYCVINSSSSSGCSWSSISNNFMSQTTITPGYSFSSDGSYTMYLHVRDLAGNVTSVSDAVIVDTTAPTNFEYYKVYQILGTRDYTANSHYSAVGGKGGNWTTSGSDPIITFSDLSDIQGIMGGYIKFGSALSYNLPIQIFYEVKGTGHNETHSARATLTAGQTEIFIKFNHTATNWTNIRFDIGSSSGLTYNIAELGVFTISSTESGVNYANWAGEASTFTRFSAVDVTSGVASFQYYGDGVSNWTTLNLALSNGLQVSGTTTTGKENWGATDGRNQTYYFRACDKAGNCTSNQTYNIKYDLSGPTFNSGPTISGTNIAFSATDSLSGVKQACLNSSATSIAGCSWYSASNGASNTVPVNYTSAGTYYVHVRDKAGSVGHKAFTANNYTVTFNGDGGTSSSQTKPQGVAVTMPTVTKNCFASIGWSPSQGSTSSSYAGGSSYAINATTTLYPVWTNSFTEDFSDQSYECITGWNTWSDNGDYFAWHSERKRIESYPPDGDYPWYTDTKNVYLQITISHAMIHNRTLTLNWGIDTASFLYFGANVRVIGSDGSNREIGRCDDCQDEGTRTASATLYAGVTYTLQFNAWYPEWYGDSWMWFDDIKIY